MAWHCMALSPNAHERTNLPPRRLRHYKEPWHGGCFTWAHGVSVARLLTATATMSTRSAYAFDLVHTREAYRQRPKAIRIPHSGSARALVMLCNCNVQTPTISHEAVSEGRSRQESHARRAFQPLHTLLRSPPSCTFHLSAGSCHF